MAPSRAPVRPTIMTSGDQNGFFRVGISGLLQSAISRTLSHFQDIRQILPTPPRMAAVSLLNAADQEKVYSFSINGFLPLSLPQAPLGAGLVAHPTYTPLAVLVALTSIPEIMGAGGEWKGPLAFSSIFSLARQSSLEMQSTCYFRLGLVHAFGLERKIQIQTLKINIPLQA